MATKLFFIYDPADGSHLAQIENQLQVFVNNGTVEIWHQGKLLGGDDTNANTQKHLKAADIVLPLVSADFLASSNCNALLQKANDLGKEIVPIIASSCMWQYDPILNAKPSLPRKDNDIKATPINKWSPVADAYAVVVEGIVEVVEKVAKKENNPNATTTNNNNSSTNQPKNTNMANENLVFENGYALLIGISYKHLPPYWSEKRQKWVSPAIDGTLNDVRDLKTHFTNPQKAAYKAENVIALTEEKATTQGILNALDELARKVENDKDASVIIAYSGHGLVDGLVPYDYKQNGVLSSKVFSEKIAAIKAKKLLVILDCCHSENLATTKDLDDANMLDTLLKDLDDSLTQTVAQIKGLTDEIAKGSGRVILTSCRTKQTSLDIGTNGLFTKVLLESLQGTENLKKDGWVRLIDLIDYVPKTVKNRAASHPHFHKQEPMFTRIENLASEDFIVCAYDIAKARGGVMPPSQPINQPLIINVNMDELKKQLLELIEENEFSQIFALIKANKNIFKGYKTFEDEYLLDNPKGTDLKRFKDRLNTFINSKI